MEDLHQRRHGNLVTVTEPNPLRDGSNLVTSYTYNALNQLMKVTMPRARHADPEFPVDGHGHDQRHQPGKRDGDLSV